MIEHNEITLEKRNQSKVVRNLSLPRQTAVQTEKSQNYMIIANGIFYNGTEAEKVYLGENLVWEKTTTPPTPTYGSKTFAGKFLDSSNSTSWVWWVDGKKTSIADKVDPETKEFNFDYNGTLTTGKYLFNGNSSYPQFERIDHIPDTSQVTDMSWMFTNNNDLLELNVSDLNTSQATTMAAMFSGCYKITTLDVSNFDTSQVTNMKNMFSDCHKITTLDVSNFDTSQVTNMVAMFSDCHKITTLDVSNFDTSQVTNMASMFYDCYALTTLDVSNFDTSQVTNMGYMFHSCFVLTTLDLSGLDVSSVTNMDNIFFQVNKLSTVLGPITGVGANWTATTNLDLHYSPLTNASAMVFINGLATVSSAKSITFSKSTYDTLTDEQIAVATSKGWNVVRSA